MRLFKSFRLLHRRTKSDGDIINIAGQPTYQAIHDSLLPSRQNVLDVTLQNSSLCGDVFSLVPSLSFNPINLYLPTPSNATSPLPSKNAAISDILNLEAELAALREANQTLKTDLADVIKEVTEVRAALYAEMSASAYRKQQMRLASQRIQGFTVTFARYEAIDQLLASIGLHKAVLDEALTALETDRSAKEVVVDAVRRAETKAGGNSLDAAPPTTITGTRHAASLNMTLQVRKELRGCKKVTKFWKQVAQQDDKHGDVITPSPSDISSIHEPLSTERRKAVRELIARRREHFVQARGLTSMSGSTSSVESATILSAYKMVTNEVLFDSNVELSGSTLNSDSTSTVQAEVVSSLPPLASESIKIELAQHSARNRFSKGSTHKRPSQPPVLRPIDPNISRPFTIPDRRAAQTHIPDRRTYPVGSLSNQITIFLLTYVVAILVRCRLNHL